MKSCLHLAVIWVVCLVASCQATGDVAANTLTITAPDPNSDGFTEGTAADGTFTLAYTVSGGGVNSGPSAITLYFSNDAGDVTTTAVTATGGNAPDGSSVLDGQASYTGVTAPQLELDEKCELYTKLCAALTVTDSNPNNNVACAEFGTGSDKAGTKTCTTGDLAATTFTVTDPPPATGEFTVGEAVEITFTLAYTASTIGGSPSDVKVYFSNDDGSLKTTPQITATGDNAPDGSAITTDGSFVDLKATITLDAANCASYTKACGSITVTDRDDTNNEACGNFGTAAGNVGTKNCTTQAATTEPPSPSPTESGVGIPFIGVVSVIIMAVAALFA